MATASHVGLVTVRRVTAIIDAAQEHAVLRTLMRLGATGYTCTSCRGSRGGFDAFDDPLAGDTRVRIETIVQPNVAEEILEYLHGPEFRRRHHTAIVCVESVQVAADDQF